MRKYTFGLLIFIAGWGLGGYTYHYWDADPGHPARPVITVPANPVNPVESAAVLTPAAPGPADDIVSLLQRDEFDAALERYESLQGQAGEAGIADARARILSHARQLIAERRFVTAEQLLQLFLVTDYRDVEARILLAEIYRSQQDLQAAIDQLFEARGHAWRPAMLARITWRCTSGSSSWSLIMRPGFWASPPHSWRLTTGRPPVVRYS
jgi:hypothetical protein